MLSVLLVFFGYSYGLIVTTNCLYDESIPTVFRTKVVDKRVSSGKTETYYLALSPQEVPAELNEVMVSRDFYEKINVDDSVRVYLKEGRYRIPWSTVTE